MTDKELHKLKRSELLELMLAQSREIDRLKKQLAHLENQLNSRALVLEQVGSIAEASLVLTRVFTDAQKAADLYLENVERICRGRASEKGAEAEWDAFLKDVMQRCSNQKGSGEANE